MGLGLKIPCLLRVVIPMDEEGGGELIGLREAGPIKKGEEGGCWAGLREAGPVEGREEDVYGIGVWGSGLRLAGGDWSWAGLVVWRR